MKSVMQSTKSHDSPVDAKRHHYQCVDLLENDRLLGYASLPQGLPFKRYSHDLNIFVSFLRGDAR